MFAVDRELLKLLKSVPDLDARAAELERQFDAEHVGVIAAGPKVYEALPETARVFETQRISARDYLLTKILGMMVEVQAEAVSVGALERDGAGQESFTAPALRFWTAMPPQLKAEAARWQETRRQLAKYGRQKVW